MFHEKLVHKVWEIQSGQEITEGISVEACVEEAWKVFWNSQIPYTVACKIPSHSYAPSASISSTTDKQKMHPITSPRI